MKRSCTLVSTIFAVASASASVISTATVSASYNGMNCNQTSTGAAVTCTFTTPGGGSGGSTANSSGSFGNLTANSASGNNVLSPFASSGSAAASFDQLLVLPGSGPVTITGNYKVVGFSSIPGGGSFGSINQAGTTQTFFFNTFGGTTSLTIPLMTTIQLGTPFDVNAGLMVLSSASGGGATETASLMLVGFTDANGRALTPQLATPEPGYAGLLGLLGILGAVRYRRRARE